MQTTNNDQSFPSPDEWPPRDAAAYVQGEEFLEILTELADAFDEHEGLPGGFALLLDWFDRRAQQNPDYFARFSTRVHLRNYMAKALRREAHRAALKWRRQVLLSPLDVDRVASATSPTPLDELSNKDTLEVLRNAITALPSREKMPLLLHLQGMSFRKIADTLEISVGTAHARFSHALDSLRASMAPDHT